MTPEQQAALLQSINDMKAEMQKTITDQQTALKSEFDERFKTVDTISETLERARQAQIAQQQQQQQTQQPQGWIPKTWDEIPKLVESKAQEIAQKTLEARDKQADAEAQRRAAEEQALEADIDKSLQLLEQSGYLPQVGNPNDYNDPGVAARRELLGAASHMGTPELDKVADTLTQLHRQNLLFDPQTKSYVSAEGRLAPLPGKFAPVGNSSLSSPSQFNGPSARELRNMSMDDLTALAERRGYGPTPTSVLDQPGGF